MIKNYVSEKYGAIKYEESIWTGKKSVQINGVSLNKIDKTTFSYNHEGLDIRVRVDGNIYKGSSLIIDDESYEVYAKTLWYEYILAFLPIVLIIVWGNNVYLCSIIPVIGGAIGGAISVALGIVSLSMMKNSNKALIKLLIGIAFLIGIFAICAGLGYALVGALS